MPPPTTTSNLTAAHSSGRSAACMPTDVATLRDRPMYWSVPSLSNTAYTPGMSGMALEPTSTDTASLSEASRRGQLRWGVGGGGRGVGRDPGGRLAGIRRHVEHFRVLVMSLSRDMSPQSAVPTRWPASGGLEGCTAEGSPGRHPRHLEGVPQGARDVRAPDGAPHRPVEGLRGPARGGQAGHPSIEVDKRPGEACPEWIYMPIRRSARENLMKIGRVPRPEWLNPAAGWRGDCKSE